MESIYISLYLHPKKELLTPYIMKRLITLFFCLSLLLPSYGSWQFPVTNFKQKEYSAGTQNWMIEQQQNGWLYFANNYGLLEFDGIQWRTHGIWNSTVIRSVESAPDGTLYVGGSNEFGRFKSDKLGGLTYEPLSLDIAQKYKNFGEVWNIHLLDNELYAQTRNYIFKQDSNGNTQVIEPKSRIYASAKIRNGIYMATADGIYLLFGDQMNALRGSEKLKGLEVRNMSAYGQNGVLIATDFGGLFIFDGEEIKPFKTDADEFIKKNQLYTMAVNDKNIAFGTVLNGLVITDIDGKNPRYINNENGLQNNTVLSLLFDDDHNLWLGLDNGVDHIRLNSPISNLYGHSNFYGSGYSSKIQKDNLYLGTNQGLYRTNYPLNPSERLTQLSILPGSQGQVWSIDEIENTLLCSHNRGLFEIKDNKFTPLFTTEGVWKVEPCQYNDNKAIIGTYNGFYPMERERDGWKIGDKLENFNHTARIFEIDRNDYIWTLTPTGVERLHINFETNSLNSEVVLKHNGDPQEVFTIHRLGKDIIVCTPGAVYKVDISGKLVEDKQLEDLLQGAYAYSTITIDPDSNLWYIKDDALQIHRYDKTTHQYTPKSEQLWNLPYFFIGGFEHINPIDNNHAIVGNVDGYALASYDPTRAKSPNRDIYIRSVTTTKNDSLIAGHSFPIVHSDIEVDYKYNSLRFQFGSAYDAMGNQKYSYRLEPMEKEWSAWSRTTQKEYTGLTKGNYILYVKMMTNDGEISESSFEFTVLPPWYATWWAYLTQLIALLIIGYAIFRNIRKRIRASQKRLEMKKDAEMEQQQQEFKQEALERESEIIRLKNERLELELKNKSQELGNILLNYIDKNEILTEIKNELKKINSNIDDKENEQARRKIVLLQNKISKNIEKNIDWNKFEENFDIVNDQFVKKLTERYPWLNKNERKLCVYIKMGLLTKEIAPLLNMSVRGIEMLRYRMRKKMELERSDDLQGFFQLLSTGKEPNHEVE